MEFTENSVVNCGECGQIGSLDEIQKHFIEIHMAGDPAELGFEVAPTPNTTKVLNPEPNDIENDDEKLHWNDEHILLLIRMVEKYDEDFNNGLKKNVWLKIATEMSKINKKKLTWEQLDSKWKGLKKTYKKVKDHNNQTGNSMKRWQFFHAMDSFLNKKPEINPLAVCSSTSDKVKLTVSESENTRENTSPMPGLSKKRKSELQARHDEKINRLDKFLKLFQVAVEHQVGKKIDDISED